MQQIGFTGETQVGPDCVYGLNMFPPNMRRIETWGDPIVGISPMAYCDPRRYYAKDLRVYDSFIRKLALFCTWLSHRHRVTLFTTDIWFDAQTIEELALALKNETHAADSRILTHEPIMATEALFSQMSSMDYIVTCRFHGVVFAHLMNIPFIAISHHPKVATLMTDLELSEYCLDIETFDLKQLTTAFTRMVINKEDIKARMAEKVTLYKKALTSHFDQLFPPGLIK